MTELKTKPNDKSVVDFLNSVENAQRKIDSFKLLDIISSLTKDKPKMWGDSIIGFGIYKHVSPSNRSIEWFKLGFSPRKNALTLYIPLYIEYVQELVEALGKVKHGKGCIYIKKLDEINHESLIKLLNQSLEQTRGT